MLRETNHDLSRGGGGNCHRLQSVKGDSRKLMGGDIRTLQRLIGGILLPS